MMQKLLRTVSACALAVAVSGAAFAQTGGSGGGGSPQAPQTRPQQPDAGSNGAAETQREIGPRGQSGDTARPKGGGSAQSPSDRQPDAAQRDDGKAPRKQDRSDTGDERQKSPRASGQGKDDGKRAADQKDQQRDRTRAGDEGDRSKAAKGADARDRDGAKRDRDGATRLSDQQRTTVRDRFSRAGADRNRVTSVNFDIRIGASVPRSVTLHALPADVIEVVPAYRSYRYVYVRDELVIVDPASYAVVAVITTGGSRAAAPRGERRLTLAAPDRAFVRDHIDRSASIRFGIGGITLGMTIPQGVALLPMPNVVVERYPTLEDYRYFVFDDDIAIVDPTTDEVVLILEN